MADKNEQAIEQLLDENNRNNVILTDKDGKEMEFMQVALIPLKDDMYTILKPISEIEGVEDDEVIIFKFTEDDEGTSLDVVIDQDIIDKVLKELNALLK